ncbi:MAG: DUF1987 domain-containing protein [Bacteroidales bacterium]|nr:DUF1987 domain-containing protein [Bacteroidales bacterium]MBN2817382.1 DUF1987 domain-containing protein [Bacteroidales bacterium]
MEKIIIEGSNHLPRVEFDLNGKLSMEGRSLPEDVVKLFSPLIDFASNLSVGSVVFDINLEYFNTATSKQLLELLKHLDANNKINEVCVNWHFEEGDEDSIEMAEIYEESLMRIAFKYIEYQEAA